MIVRLFASLLLRMFEGQHRQASPFAPVSTWHGASDASASETGAVFLGGWLSHLDNPQKKEVFWFHYQITPEKHPWAFEKGDPKRKIGDLEMFGSLLLAKFLILKDNARVPNLRIPMVSDNQGNIHSMLNQKTQKLHPALVLMEMLLQIHAAGLQLAPSHVKRHLNTWADELTHPNFAGICKEKEVSVESVLPHFSLLNTVLYGPTPLI